MNTAPGGRNAETVCLSVRAMEMQSFENIVMFRKAELNEKLEPKQRLQTRSRRPHGRRSNVYVCTLIKRGGGQTTGCTLKKPPPHLSVITRDPLASPPFFSLCVFVQGPPNGALGINYKARDKRAGNVCAVMPPKKR